MSCKARLISICTICTLALGGMLIAGCAGTAVPAEPNDLAKLHLNGVWVDKDAGISVTFVQGVITTITADGPLGEYLSGMRFDGVTFPVELGGLPVSAWLILTESAVQQSSDQYTVSIRYAGDVQLSILKTSLVLGLTGTMNSATTQIEGLLDIGASIGSLVDDLPVTLVKSNS